MAVLSPRWLALSPMAVLSPRRPLAAPSSRRASPLAAPFQITRRVCYKTPMQKLENAHHVYSVSELTATVRQKIERGFPHILLEGEVSDFRSPGRAGHWYFNLKDEHAQVRCAMFANRNRFVRRPLNDGALVVVRCRLSLYEARGDFQAIVDAVEPAGEGELRAAFERLKIKLEHEGLFAADRKQALPTLPQHVGIVSSLSGAALQDTLAVLRRRFPCVHATCYAATVQGTEAVAEIIDAIERAEGSKPRPDVLLLTRGGGSLEDLMAFNSEALARRMARCSIPIVSAVGHETDVTIADFVADQRAPTPSAAAEMVTPDRAELLQRIRRRMDALSDGPWNGLNRNDACSMQPGAGSSIPPGRWSSECNERTSCANACCERCNVAQASRRHTLRLPDACWPAPIPTF